MKLVKYFIFCLVVSTSLPAPADILINANLGLSYPDYEDVTLRSAYSGSGHYILKNNLALGGYYYSSPKVEDFGRFHVSVSGVDIAYRIQNWNQSLIGLRLGLANVTWEPIPQTITSTPFAMGLYFRYVGWTFDPLDFGFIFSVYSVNGDSLVIPPDTSIELENFFVTNFLFSIGLRI